MPLVIKADGLAAGKGVFVVNSQEEGFKALAEIKKIQDIMWQAFSVPASEES